MISIGSRYISFEDVNQPSKVEDNAWQSSKTKRCEKLLKLYLQTYNKLEKKRSINLIWLPWPNWRAKKINNNHFNKQLLLIKNCRTSFSKIKCDILSKIALVKYISVLPATLLITYKKIRKKMYRKLYQLSILQLKSISNFNE